MGLNYRRLSPAHGTAKDIKFKNIADIFILFSMYGILKKKYGQNFLIDKNIIKKICNLIPKKNLNIIEIGPGDGRLTEHII